jgi:hypothetical protein
MEHKKLQMTKATLLGTCKTDKRAESSMPLNLVRHQLLKLRFRLLAMLRRRLIMHSWRTR